MISFAPWRPRAEDADVAQLVARVAHGDRAALAVLYRREAGPVYRYALALCANAAWAADATQEAFLALAEQPQGFDATRGSLGAYLAGAARHTLLAHWRQARRELPEQPLLQADDDAPGADVASPVSPEQLMVQLQDTQALWAALNSLSWALREAVVLVDLQERAYTEAAQIAGIPLNTLRTRLHRARLRLATLLAAINPRAST
jgi:RNA polymerase sigma-70 factor, ECF subfamily